MRMMKWKGAFASKSATKGAAVSRCAPLASAFTARPARALLTSMSSRVPTQSPNRQPGSCSKWDSSV